MYKWLTVLFGSMAVMAQSQPKQDTTDWISGIFPHFRTLTVGDGLSQSSVVDVTQDRTGYWWLATQDGLNRYDGRHITIYEKYFEDVTRPGYSRLGRLFVDRAGDLWLIPSTGMVERRDAKTGKFEEFPFLKNISCILQDSKGRYWATTYADVVYRFDPQDGILARYAVSGNGYDLLEDQNGQIWLAASSGVYYFESIHKKWSKAGSQTNTPSYSRLAEQSDGTIWAGTHSQGLYYKKSSENTFRLFTGFEGNNKLSPNLYTLALHTDPQQRLWVGTYGQGVYQLDPKTRTISHFQASKTQSNALAYDDVLDVFEDRTGVIVVGTDGGGISVYDPFLIKFRGYTASQVPTSVEVEQVRAICTDANQTVWLGTSGKGLTSFTKNGAWSTFRLNAANSSSLPNDRIMSLLPNPDGTIWVGTQGAGLARFDTKVKQYTSYGFRQGFPDQTIWCLFRDSNGRQWAGTQKSGLVRFNENGKMIGQFKSGLLTSSDVKVITEGEAGKLWIATEGMGLNKLDPRTGICRKWKLSAQKFGNVIKCLYYDDSNQILWIGTLGGGLISFNPSTGATRQYTDKNGLPNNVVYGILPDQEGYLWLSTNKGLCRFKIGLVGQRPEISRYTTDDGLQSMEFNTGAYYRSPDGILFFGGVAGFNGFLPGKIKGKSGPPKVAITDIEINGQSIGNDTLPERRSTLTLLPDQKTIAVTVAALHFSLPMRNKFRYKLDGYDSNWTNAGTRNYIRYTNLPANQYTLRVQAANYDGVWSKDEARLSFTIRPHIWERWWFILLILLIVSSILYAIYRYRINQIMRIQAIRNRLSADLHDEIGSSLSSISILGTLAGNTLDQKHPAFSFVKRITEESRLISRSMSDIVWSINPRNDELESLLSRMNRFASELLEAQKIEFSFNVVSSSSLNQLKLSMEQRRDLYLLFKECINNLIKYSKSTKVLIEIRVQTSTLSLLIQDNGVGFDTKVKSSGNGLINMNQRAKNLNGNLFIESEPAGGTIVRLTFPFNQITHKGYWL